MTLSTYKMHNELDFMDLLNNQSWTITIHETPTPEDSAADVFLDTLLGGSDCSAPASPLWSPCTTDSGIAEDPPTDPRESPQPSCGAAFPAFDLATFPQPPPVGNQLPLNDEAADVSADQTFESNNHQEQLGIAHYLTSNQGPSLSSSQTLTVKDLLLSNLGQEVQRIPQHSLSELKLNEDEKTLLAKEGLNLPSRLPLSKFEERVLKKIRRKIRNKRSAQESRKKKREYVDSLEGRMSACSANNLELQRKIQQLEETNNALLEQLNWLHALLSNGSNKTTHKGTCILPDPYSQLGQGQYTETKVPSRSLKSMEKVQDVPPPTAAAAFLSVSRSYEALCSFTKRLWASAGFSIVAVKASHHQDYRQRDDH